MLKKVYAGVKEGTMQRYFAVQSEKITQKTLSSGTGTSWTPVRRRSVVPQLTSRIEAQGFPGRAGDLAG